MLRGVEEDLRFRFRSLLERYARQLDEAEGRTVGAGAVAAADTSEQARASQDADMDVVVNPGVLGSRAA